MIPNEEKEGCHYHALKELSGLLRKITSKHHGDFYCLNCLHSFATKSKLKSHEEYFKKKIYVELLCQLKKIIY